MKRKIFLSAILRGEAPKTYTYPKMFYIPLKGINVTFLDK